MRAKTILTTTLIALMLVISTDYIATAATGRPLLLGRFNSAGSITTLSRSTPGPALKIQTTNATASPLTTNARGKVANLNADKVDGFDAGALRTSARTYSVPARSSVTTFTVAFEDLPPAIYLASYRAVATMSDLKSLNCLLERPGGAGQWALAYGGLGAGSSTYSAVSASDIIDTRSEGIVMRCFSSGATFSSSASGITATFVRVDSLSTSAATNARSAPRAQAGAAG